MQSTFKCCGVYDSDEWVELEGKVPSSCCSLSSSDQCQKLHDSGCLAAVLTTIVVGGSIILASILGVVSVFQNTKGMIYWFQLTMIFLMLAQAVLALQGFFHLMAYQVNEEM